MDGSRILIGKSPAHVINRTLRLAGSPLLVAVGYYIGTRVGFLMTPSGEPNSTFWPANAILLAAFLLAPRRVWWTFVLAVLPAHMLAQVQSGVPVWTQLGWFISNSAEALIGAYCITRFSREERRFETVRGVLVFILFGVLVSPFVTSFLDAAVVVVTGWGHSYWPLGAERFWTNALAELTVVPVVVLGGLNGIRWIRNVDSVHRREAVLLGTVTILAALCVFGFRSASAVTLPAVLYLPLPLLLWAAVRFRLGGLSLSVLCMALISMWYTMHGRLPFPYASMRQNILSLQVLFCVVGVPLMFLSALMDETQGVQESLQNVNAELIRQAAVIESSHDAIASGTLDGIIVSWNAGAERLYGYTEAEAIGKPITMLVPPELPDEEKKILETLRTGGQIEHFETVRVTKAGKKINVSLTISPIKDSTGKTVGISGIARDITGQKRAEEALRASEERLRLAQWAARIGTFDLNLRTGVDIWTPETEALYGLPPGGFGGTQTAFENLIHPDDRERIAALTQEMIRTGQPVEEEWRVVWPDGSVHWIAGRGQVLKDESGQPSRMIGVNIDVTAHKLAEQELAKANEQLRLAIEAGSVGGWDFDVKSAKNVWFGKAYAQLGMATDETSGLREEFWARVHEDDRERLQNTLQTAKDKREEFTEEFRVVWRDGTTHWLRSRGRYYYAANGEAERMLGISVDVTESKEAEKALRESEQRFRLAEQAGRMYSFEWDVATGTVVRSSEHLEVLGVTQPLRTTHQQFVDRIHPDDRATFLSTVAGLTPENPAAEITYRVRMADHRAPVWLKSSGCAFFDSKGKMLRVIGMVADITPLKRAEEELSAMTRKLIEAQEQERARIGRELHDDINQRLAMLSIELKRLQDNPSAIDTRVQELRNRVEEISVDVQALSHDLHSSKLEYLGVVAGIKSWCREFSERQKMDVDFKSDVQSVLPVEIGRTLLRVLQEALHNASKHSGARRVGVQLEETSGEIHLIVRDWGKGFNVEAALQGSGLGLTSMRERVRLVSGTITIDSEPQRGTSIHVRVPIPSEPASERAAG